MNRKTWRIIANKLFALRWVLVLALLSLAVVLKLNGSSLGAWGIFVPDGAHPDDGIIWGEDRPIRSDEWAVFTPMALSQYANDFQRTSTILRGTETDVYMVYGQPVRDWSILFRPFQIGYLLFDAARGLSFYWYGRLAFLFLISIELGLVLLKRSRLMALTYAFTVTFAPAVQWWFSTNAFVDMLIYGQGILLCIAGYLNTGVYWKRILLSLLGALLGGAYLLVLYPAWQVPFFYVFLVLGLWIIVERWGTFSWSWKKDLPILVAAVLLLAAAMAVVVHRSWDAIMAVIHSAYPGVRSEKGGVGLTVLFRYVGNLISPFNMDLGKDNVCEMACFYDGFPLGIILALMARRRSGKWDRLTAALLGLAVFLGLYVVLGFPKALARWLLLGQSQAWRARVAVSFVNLLLLLRAFLVLRERKEGLSFARSLVYAGLFGVTLGYYAFRWEYPHFSPTMVLLCVAALGSVALWALNGKRAFCVTLIVLSLLMGATVNPVRQGLGPLENHSLGKAIQTCTAEEDGKWLAVSNHWMMGNFLIAYGASTINNTNTYMNPELWSVVDPEGAYEEVYNRYCHITASLTSSEEPVIELGFADSVRLELPVSMLRPLNVRFVVSDQDMSQYEHLGVSFQPMFEDPNVTYRIYRLSYGKAQ